MTSPEMVGGPPGGPKKVSSAQLTATRGDVLSLADAQRRRDAALLEHFREALHPVGRRPREATRPRIHRDEVHVVIAGAPEPFDPLRQLVRVCLRVVHA